MPEVIVIGGGVAGFGAALELAERGYQVKIIEKSLLGSGASGRNPGRMGHGFHYVNVETAIMYLRASIQAQRKYPHYVVGRELPNNHPIRHGRFFITKDSDNRPQQILATYEKIKEEYIRLIAEDPANEVFGPPEHFFRILTPSEYEGQVNSERVLCGVETAEHLFDFGAFLKDMRKTILSNPNITLYEQSKVEHIERGRSSQPRFTLHVKDTGSATPQKKVFHADYLVNSTWQNIEQLNDELGIGMQPGARTNRLKTLLVVKLPESLLNAHSMFFCMGQHCMFSNLGQGYGMMTFAEVTNMETSTGLTLSARAIRLLEGGVRADESDIIAKRILAGVATYIPDMAKAEVLDLKFGIVQTAGALTLGDLKDPNSSFHKRDYDGIREEQLGLISNPCMKLFYFVRNGQVVADIVDAEVEATAKIRQDVLDIVTEAKKAKIPIKKDLVRAFSEHLDRSIDSRNLDRLMSTGMIESLLKKQVLMSELKVVTQSKMLQKTLDKGALPLQDFPAFYLQAICDLSIEWVATLILSISFATLAIGAVLSMPFAVATGITAGFGWTFFSGDSTSDPIKTSKPPHHGLQDPATELLKYRVNE